jgi:hypothetical protein
MFSRNALRVVTLNVVLLLPPARADESAANNQGAARVQADKFAWQLFIVVNRQVDLPGSGTPPKRGLFWESWATPDYVFRDANKPPTWKDRKPSLLELKPLFKAQLASKGRVAAALPGPCENGYGQEIRLNEPTVRFIADNKLYSVEGQIALSRKGPVDFPEDSIEIKAYWDNISESEKDNFYSRKCEPGGTYYGLTALHIISKAAPNWTWATFEHISTGRTDLYNPDQCRLLTCRDSFGASPSTGAVFQSTPALANLFKDAGMLEEWRKIWRHYRLIGSQSDFVKGDGRPTRLGNSKMENQFGATSSCITCHSRASIQIDGSGADRLLPNTADGQSFNGVPSPCWYLGKDGSRKFGRLDFIWSLLNAKSETGNLNPNFVLNDCS